MTDDVSKVLEGLRGELPTARTGLSDSEKDALVARIGPRTARDIVKAKKDVAAARIPFLFSTVDTQAVVDLLANEMTAAIAKALAAAKAKKKPRG